MKIFNLDNTDLASNPKIIMPNDSYLLANLLDLDPSIVFGGSFVDSLYLNNFNENNRMEFNDLDIMCSNLFLNNIAKKNIILKKYLDDFRIECKKMEFFFHNGFMNEPGKTPQSIFFNGIEYPPQVKGSFKGKNLDCFLVDCNKVKYKNICYSGVNIRILKINHRILMLESMLNTKLNDEWLNDKQKHKIPMQISKLKNVIKLFE